MTGEMTTTTSAQMDHVADIVPRPLHVAPNPNRQPAGKSGVAMPDACKHACMHACMHVRLRVFARMFVACVYVVFMYRRV